MHQNKLISPFPTPFGHLHFHSTHILTLAETCLLRHIKPRIDVENFGVVVTLPPEHIQFCNLHSTVIFAKNTTFTFFKQHPAEK